MEIKSTRVGLYQTNAYFLTENNHTLVIDPGDGDDLVLYLLQNQPPLDAVVVTHGHLDHFGDAAAIAEKWNVPVYFPQGEAAYLTYLKERRLMYRKDPYDAFEEALKKHGRFLNRGDRLEWQGHSFQAILVTGHTPCSLCLYDEKEKKVWTGDTLFYGSIGRMDFCEEGEQLPSSIREHLLVLPDETRVFPGHGEETAIGFERRMNPFLMA